MSNVFSIRDPSVLATLPRPIESSNGRYVVSDVHGGMPGSRKRKRDELVVGIKGEGLNIYDIKSSRLVTSYALPPQASFTCPPYSTRLRKPKKGGVERRTYTCTEDQTSTITLFRDVKMPEGLTASEVITAKLSGSANPTFMSTLPHESYDDLLLVRRDGEIQCLDGETLEMKWSSPATAISKHASVPDITDFKVEFADISDAYSASKGLFTNQKDSFALFPKMVSRKGFNPLLLIVITSPSDAILASTRTLHVLLLPQDVENSPSGRSNSQAARTLLTLQIPWGHMESPQSLGDMEYNLQAMSGILYELAGGYLTIFDLSGSVAQIKAKIPMDANSFIPLLSTSILVSSHDIMSLYHPAFRSIQASIDLKAALGSSSFLKKRKLDNNDEASSSKTCRLVGYSMRQGVALAISGVELLSFQIEAREEGKNRSRSLGLLIDSIGRGILNTGGTKPHELKSINLGSFGRYISGSTDDGGRAETIKQLDILIERKQITEFENNIAKLIGLTGQQNSGTKDITDLDSQKWNSTTNSEFSFHPSMFPQRRSKHYECDPAWIRYAISRIFNWSSDQPDEQMRESITSRENRLQIVFFPPNVLNWLIQTGNLNKVNIASSFQSELRTSGVTDIPAGQIVTSLVKADPTMNLLLSLLSSTYLEAPELLYAVRALMDSLGIFGDRQDKLSILENSDGQELTNGDLDAEIEFEQDQADLDLQLAEYRLSDGSSVRHEALSMALAKLYTCPSTSVIQAIQSTMDLNEILSLVYLLRFELAGGSWTSRYLDFFQASDDSSPPDSAIMLISTLLGRCIDAVGASGWLTGDAMLASGNHLESEELITSLKLEVSAALEGIEEASYLRGLTSEMVKFADSTEMATVNSKKRTRAGDTKPILVPQVEEDVALLPFGLKVEQQVSLQKVGAGGELYVRSLRDIGRLKSKKVGKYSRERIVL